jgi:PAS domain S-box-containing protein
MNRPLPDVSLDERRVRELIRQLTAIEAELDALVGGVDAVLDYQAAPLLLRQAQVDLQQRTTELARAHATLQALFDNSLDAILLADDEGRYVDINRAAVALLGRSREELLKSSIWEVTPGVHQELGRSLWQDFITAGRQTAEYTLVRGDGSTVDVEYRAVANIRPGLHMSIMRDITHRKAAEAALKLQAQQLQALSHRLVQVQEAERRAVSRELHDETGQALTALKLGLGLLRRETAHLPAPLAQSMQTQLDELRTMVDAVMDGIHQLAVSLRPVSLDRYGLAPAMEQYLGSLRKVPGLETEFVVGDLPTLRLPSEMETTLYRVVQEASTNVIRHAHATRLSVMLTAHDSAINLLIEDNGVGFNLEEALKLGRLGLSGIRERVQMLGGVLDIESSPGRGTTIYVQVPYYRDREETA